MVLSVFYIDQGPDSFVLVRQSLAEVEKSQPEAVAERNAAEQWLQAAEKTIWDLEAKLDKEGRESSQLDILRQRLSDKLEDEHKQQLKDLTDHNFITDQMRNKYQGQCMVYIL